MTPTADRRAGEHSRRIVVCADDFGLGAAVDAAVFDLAQRGRISATSALVDAPHWPRAAAEAARTLVGRIDVGLHLNLTEAFRPGGWLPWRTLVVRAALRQLDGNWARTQLDRQLDRFADTLGRAPDFVDGHRHVHQLPVVREALLAALAARGWRPWLRCTRAAPAAVPHAERFKARVIEALGGRAFERAARRAGHATNRRLLGVYGFTPAPAVYAARLAAWLAAAADADLLMCHPAAAGAAAADDPIAAARVVEHTQLAGPAFSDLLAANAMHIERLGVMR